MTGGKREGAGRPPAVNPANKMISVKLTQEQYRRWVEIGASRWLKRMLNDLSQPQPTIGKS
jgi:hypothetical protein